MLLVLGVEKCRYSYLYRFVIAHIDLPINFINFSQNLLQNSKMQSSHCPARGPLAGSPNEKASGWFCLD